MVAATRTNRTSVGGWAARGRTLVDRCLTSKRAGEVKIGSSLNRPDFPKTSQYSRFFQPSQLTNHGAQVHPGWNFIAPGWDSTPTGTMPAPCLPSPPHHHAAPCAFSLTIPTPQHPSLVLLASLSSFLGCCRTVGGCPCFLSSWSLQPSTSSGARAGSFLPCAVEPGPPRWNSCSTFSMARVARPQTRR